MSKLLYVEWVDSVETEGWRPTGNFDEDDGKAKVCHSIGWVLVDTDEVLVIAPHVMREAGTVPEQACGVMEIPKVAIKIIIELERIADV